MEEGGSISVLVRFEGVDQAVPTARVPLDGEASVRICRVEALRRVPRDGVFQDRLWQTSVTKYAQTLEFKSGCFGPLTGPALGQDAA